MITLELKGNCFKKNETEYIENNISDTNGPKSLMLEETEKLNGKILYGIIMQQLKR